MKYLIYKGYKGSVEFSEDDNLYYGKILNIKDLVTFESQYIEGIEQQFKDAVDDYTNSKK